MTELSSIAFDPAAFLAQAGLGRRIVQLKAKEAFFSQGSSADSIFYLQKGRAKLTVVSMAGKEATLRSSMLASLSARSAWREWPDFAWRRHLRSPLAPR